MRIFRIIYLTSPTNPHAERRREGQEETSSEIEKWMHELQTSESKGDATAGGWVVVFAANNY